MNKPTQSNVKPMTFGNNNNMNDKSSFGDSSVSIDKKFDLNDGILEES